MKTSIVRTDVWKDEDLYKLHLDSKLLYLFILSSPERGLTNIMVWSTRFASMYTGMNQDQIAVALKELTDKGFVEVYNGYIAILKEHFSVSRNRYSEEQITREMEALPEDVYAHLIDKKPVAPTPKKERKPKEAKPDVTEAVIKEQPAILQEALRALVQDRKARNKPMSEIALNMALKKLEKMYPNNPTKQVASIEQTIERGWTGLFEVKEDARAESEFA